jgi:hypothetical protein
LLVRLACCRYLMHSGFSGTLQIVFRNAEGYAAGSGADLRRWQGVHPPQRRRSRRPGAAASRTPHTASCIHRTLQLSAVKSFKNAAAMVVPAAPCIMSCRCCCMPCLQPNGCKGIYLLRMTARRYDHVNVKWNILAALVCAALQLHGEAATTKVRTLGSAGSASPPACQSWGP